MPLMREFLTVGQLGSVRVGMSVARLLDVLGPPDDESVQRRPVYIVRYGTAQFAFVPGPYDRDGYRMVGVAMYFDQPGRELPSSLQCSDWTPSRDTTELAFRQFAAGAGLQPHPDAAWRCGNVMFPSGATAVFDGGRLHSLHFHRPQAVPS